MRNSSFSHVLAMVALLVMGCVALRPAAEPQAQTAVAEVHAPGSPENGPSSGAKPAFVPADPSSGEASAHVDRGEDDEARQQARRQVLLEGAERAIAEKRWTEAVRLSAEWEALSPSDDARALAFYAASQLSAESLSQALREADPGLLLQTAALARQQWRLCVRSEQQNCAPADIDRGLEAMQALGLTAEARRLREDYSVLRASSSRPLVAVLLPLSGRDRRIGRAMLGAVLQGAGIFQLRPLAFDLRFFDTQSDAAKIPQIIDDAKRQGAKLLLGPIDVQESLAASQRLEARDLVMVGFSINEAFVGERAYRLSYDLTQEVMVSARAIISENAKKIVVVAPDTRYTTMVVDRLRQALAFEKDVNIQLQTFPEGKVDLRDVAKSVAKIRPDLVFLPTSPETSELIASFLAQENMWCRTSFAPTPSRDTRHFMTCLGTGLWGPIAQGHPFKFIVGGVYPDYIDATPDVSEAFAHEFQNLFHRLPAVHEILPYQALTMLRTLRPEAFASSKALIAALESVFQGRQFVLQPSLRQITRDASVRYQWGGASQTPPPQRTLVTRP